ncbi:MAG: hypothetical protein K9N55_18910 [Phycisphaerae bacterium]|nr:hypothetical protein [Phycisphaerae bacterium]
MNRYIGSMLGIALVSFCLLCAHAQPQKVTEPRDNAPTELLAAEPNQVRTVLSWGSHESIKECISCHVNALDADATPEQAGLKSPVPQLCTTCHTALSNLKGWVHGPVATGECLICHAPHQTTEGYLLRKDPPQLCHQCHETASLDLISRHKDPAYAECQTCHQAHTGPNRMLLRPEFIKAQALLDLMNPKVTLQSRFVGHAESLQGIDGIQVTAGIDRAKRFEAYGLTPEKLNQLVERLLEQHGIPVLTQDTRTDHTGILDVHLRLVEVPSPQSGQIAAVSGSLNLSLRQTVELPPLPGDDTHRTCSATTWDTGSLVVWGTRQCEKGLAEALEVFVLQFGQAYTQANAKP